MPSEQSTWATWSPTDRHEDMPTYTFWDFSDKYSPIKFGEKSEGENNENYKIGPGLAFQWLEQFQVSVEQFQVSIQLNLTNIIYFEPNKPNQ